MKKILFSFLTVTILSTFATFAFAKDEQIAATVNGEKIYKEEVSKRMWQNHFENTINNIVDETLLLQEGKKLKIKVSKKETDNRLKEIKSAYNIINSEDTPILAGAIKAKVNFLITLDKKFQV